MFLTREGKAVEVLRQTRYVTIVTSEIEFFCAMRHNLSLWRHGWEYHDGGSRV